MQKTCLPWSCRRHLYSGIECILSKFANDTNLYDVINTLEGRDAVQRDLDRSERRTCTNLMMFNKAKCNILYLDCGNPKHKYKVGGEWTESSLRKRTLWLLVDEKLNMSWQLAAHKSGQQCKGFCPFTLLL